MKKNIIKIAIITWLLPVVSCKKEMMRYEGIEGVYFAVQHGASYGSPLTWPYQPYTNVEFVKLSDNEATINIKVMVTGLAKDYDRPFEVEINPDSTTATLGVHYKALPKGLFIPANSLTANVPVTLKRTEDLQKAEKTIGLRLVTNTYFGLSFPEWDAIPGFTASTAPITAEFNASLHKIIINDFMVQPAVWIGSIQPGNREAGLWGPFSRKKLELMCEIMHLTYADFSSAATMPGVRYNLVASECARYLIEKFNAKTPVLEDDGRLMFIGSVPWTSYIGVKYVP